MLEPENIRYILFAMRQNKTMNVAQIRKLLCNEAGYTIDEINNVLLKAVLDGLLQPTAADTFEKIQSSNSLKDNIMLKVKDIKNLTDNLIGRDPYCYECHKPGLLQNCTDCARTFHVNCQRKDVFLANSTNNIKLKDHVPIETFLNDDVSDLNSSSNRDHDEHNRSLTSIDDTMIDEFYTNITPNKLKEESFENDKIDEKNDVLCIGQIREPKRKRANNNLNENYKNEITNNDDDNNDSNDNDDKLLCTKCKLIKKSSTLDPGNITNEEICYLLQFVFNRIASWIPLDTFATVPKSKSFHPPEKDELNFIKKYCFKYPKSLSDIEQKIKNEQYNSFTEFYLDFLDIQHCIGILYGIISEEYLATEYQIKDCNYELSEIRQCRDCYRRSNDKNYITDWFCIPCVPRHELVYAKKTPWPYWPAKVIKFKDNKYDVRFFSERHERAIIDAKYIKPIEVYNPPKTSSALRKALLELEKYQIYDQQPAGTFSFKNERVLNRTITPLNLQNKTNTENVLNLKNKKIIRNLAPILSNENTSNNTRNGNKSAADFQIPSGSRIQSELINDSVSKRMQSNKRKKSNSKSGSKKYYDIVENLGKKIDKISNKDEIKKIVMETMQTEIKSLKDKIKELTAEIIDIKTKSWCKCCLQPATLYCCSNISYCTLECQKLDWNKEHKYKCSHKNETK